MWLVSVLVCVCASVSVDVIQPGALVAIMNLLPPILTGLAILEGCISFSSNQFRSFDRFAS